MVIIHLEAASSTAQDKALHSNATATQPANRYEERGTLPCWFGPKCRGWHNRLELAHFNEREIRAAQLDQQYCNAGVCAHDGYTGRATVSTPQIEGGQNEDIFYDATLFQEAQTCDHSKSRVIVFTNGS